MNTRARCPFRLALIVLLTVGPKLAAAGRSEPAPPELGPDAPRSVVLIIADGLGDEHLEAAESYLGSVPLAVRFPHVGRMTTLDARGRVPDSAAAGTAIATGVAVRNGVIAQALPGDGRPLPTVADAYVARGAAFGIVTTSELTHATPAAFAAHARSRNHRRAIADDYLNRTGPNYLFGGGGAGLTVEATAAAGYRVATSLDELEVSGDAAPGGGGVALLIGDGHLPYILDARPDLFSTSGVARPSPDTDLAVARPALGSLVEAALARLERDSDGFFLMVEAARIDHASHANDFPRMLGEMVDFLDAVDRTLAWLDAGGRDDVLVVVTSDHETGGFSLEGDVTDVATARVSWSTDGHTDAPVPIFALGPNAAAVADVRANVDLFDVLLGRPVSAE